MRKFPANRTSEDEFVDVGGSPASFSGFKECKITSKVSKCLAHVGSLDS